MPDIEGVPYEATGGKIDQATAQALAARHREAATAGAGAASAAVAPVQAQVSALSSRVDSQDAKTLTDAKAYTDTKVTGLATTAAMQAGDALTLSNAKTYTDAQLAGFNGNGIETVSGTVTLDASGEPIREFFTTGTTTFSANGTTVQVGAFTAVVWRRTGVGSWGYQVVPDEWTTPTPTPDTTAPVAGTLAVSVTDVSASLTVSGASDDRGVTGYAFQVNGGAWSSWQTSPSYTATGLTPSTSHQFRHKVRDAAGNETQGAVVSATTTAKPTPTTPTVVLTDTVASQTAADTGQAYYATTGRTSGDTMTLTSADHNGIQPVATAPAYQDIEFDFTPTKPGGHVVNFWGNNADTGTRAGVYIKTSENSVSFFGTGPATKTTGAHTFTANTMVRVKIELRGLDVKVYLDGIQKASGTFTQAQRDSMTAPSWVQFRNYNGTHEFDNIKVTTYA